MNTNNQDYNKLFFLNPLPNLVYSISTFKILEINEAAMDLYEYTREDFLKLTIKDITKSEEVSKLLILHSNLYTKSKDIYVSNFTHKKKNGESIRIEINGQKVKFLNQECLIITCKDVTEKELQLKELKESKKKLKAASAIAKLGYWKLELDANTLSWSDKVYHIWGRTKGDFEVNFENFFQTIHPDDRAVFELEQSASFAGEKEHDFAHRIILPNGDIRWVHELGRLVKDKNGIPIAFEGTVRNITEQKNRELEQNLINQISEIFNNEENLNNATQKLCEVFADFGHFDLAEIWLPNIEKSQIQLNNYHNQSGNTDVFYREASNVISLNFGEGLPGTIWKTKKAVLLDDVHSKEHFIRKKAAKKAGITSLLGIPLVFKGEIAGVLVIGSKKKADKLLQYSKIFYRLETLIGSEINRKQLENSLSYLFEAIPDIICLIDFKGRFLRMNKAGCLLLGYFENEILYNSFENFVHPDDINVSRNQIKKLREGETVFKFENRYITKKKEVLWLSWTCNAELKEGVIYASAKDITAEKKLRELNRQANSIARIGSWEVDLTSGRTFWSDMVHNIHETNSSLFTPEYESSINFFREDFLEMVRRSMENCIDKGEPFNFEAVIVTAQKNERWVRGIGNAEMVNGKSQRLYGSLQDIHATKMIDLQFSEILSSISDAFYALDKDWNITYFNKEAENLLQKKSVDIIGKSIWEEFPVTLGTPLEEIYQNVLRLKKSVSFEYLFPGDDKWYEINVYSSNGGISVYFKNIDERKETAEIIKKASQEKTMILESIGDAFFSMDRNFIITYWNKKAEELVFTKRETIVGRNLFDVFPTAIDLPSYRNYCQILQTGEAVVFEDFFADKYLEINAYPSENGITAFFRDISERKKAEQQIVAANERFEKVTEATNDAIWDLKIEENILYWGIGFKKLFGYDLNKIIPTMKFWKENVHSDDLDAVQNSLLKVEKDIELYNWKSEYRFKRADGTYAFVEDRAVVIRNEEGKAIRIIGAATDISQRKLQEIKLKEVNESLKKHAHELELSNEQLEQFAFIASHDLQEPLRMITSFMNQLERKYSSVLDEKAHQYIYFATDGAKRMKQIILDLLEYSRAGKFEEKKEMVNLMDLINDYKNLRRKIIEEKAVVINCSNLTIIEAYRVPLIQTLHSLLDNAIKYTPENVSPVIIVNHEDKPKEWLFTVKDNGLGISEQFFKKIFVIFQRLHNRSKYDGTGIGLAIAKKNIEFWGGRIWLESEEGKGSIFYFTVPKNQ